MSLQGIVLIDLMGFVFILLLINLVRTNKLHVGFAAIWLTAVSALILLRSTPPLLELATRSVGAIYPASALSLMAFVLIFTMLIAFSVQLSAISSKQIEIIQALALRELLEQDRRSLEKQE